MRCSQGEECIWFVNNTVVSDFGLPGTLTPRRTQGGVGNEGSEHLCTVSGRCADGKAETASASHTPPLAPPASALPDPARVVLGPGDDGVPLVVERTGEDLVLVPLQLLRHEHTPTHGWGEGGGEGITPVQTSHACRSAPRHNWPPTCMQSPVSTSHNIAARSPLHVSTRFPCGLNVACGGRHSIGDVDAHRNTVAQQPSAAAPPTLLISPSCPTSVVKQAPVAVLYTRLVPSADAVTSLEPAAWTRV